MADQDLKYRVSAEDRFSAVFASLRRDISSSGQVLQGFRATAASALSFATFGSVASIGGAALAVRQLARDLDSLNDAADATGDTVENLSALEDVARRNGENLGAVVTAVQRLNKVLQEATPDSVGADALKRIGLDAAALRRQAPTEALRAVAGALNSYAEDGDKARLSIALLGRSSTELAPLLKDIAEAGKVNATVTTEQAKEAERFNKELAALSTNAGNAARSIVSELLPAFGRLLEAVRKGGGVGVAAALGLDDTGQLERRLDDVNARARRLSDSIARMSTEQERDPGNSFLAGRVEAARQRLAALQREASGYSEALKKVANQLDPFNAGDRSREDRGFVPALPKIGDTSGLGGNSSASAARVTEAQRLLETLQRQGDQVERLTTLEQLQRDISRGRIEGLNPALQQQLVTEARRVDLLKAQTAELNAQQESLDALIQRSLQRDSELDRELADTDTGRRRDIERRLDRVVAFSRANPADEGLQRQALEAVTRLRAEASKIGEVPAEAAPEWKKLEVTIDRFAQASTDAIADFVVDGKGSFGDLFRSFAKDILREQIEAPVKEAMRNVLAIIRDAAKQVDGGNNPFARIFDFLRGGGGSGGSGGGFDWGSLLNLIGFTSRANGGDVNAGRIVRWQENGREWFVPGQDGSVLTQAQLRAMQGAAPGGTVQISQRFEGDVSPRTLALARRMAEQLIEQYDRKRRYGLAGR
jgi:hypothetical protein